MRIPRIYTPQPLNPDSTIELNENASRHIGKVLRMQSGRELILFNGDGAEYSAVIVDVGKKVVRAEVQTQTSIDRESPLLIELAIGISRGERMDWVLQKATELGVNRITPLFTERTEVKLRGDRQDKKNQHWQHIVISACEQCQRNTLPMINDPLSFAEWLPTVTAKERFVLHHRTQHKLSDQQKPASVCLLIGPEGGLTDSEILLAEKHKFNPLALGPRVLRTETAPVVAISILQFLWGDLGG